MDIIPLWFGPSLFREFGFTRFEGSCFVFINPPGHDIGAADRHFLRMPKLIPIKNPILAGMPMGDDPVPPLQDTVQCPGLCYKRLARWGGDQRLNQSVDRRIGDTGKIGAARRGG